MAFYWNAQSMIGRRERAKVTTRVDAEQAEESWNEMKLLARHGVR